MYGLEGFTAFNFSEGVPYISVTPNGITFNKSVTMKLGYPEYVQFLINAEQKVVALRPCSQEEENATVYFRPKQNGILSVRWNARDLINTLEFITGWNLKESTYRIDGQYLPELGVMIFELAKAVELT